MGVGVGRGVAVGLGDGVGRGVTVASGVAVGADVEVFAGAAVAIGVEFCAAGMAVASGWGPQAMMLNESRVTRMAVPKILDTRNPLVGIGWDYRHSNRVLL